MINQNFGYILIAMLENMMIYQSKFTLCVLNFVSYSYCGDHNLLKF